MPKGKADIGTSLFLCPHCPAEFASRKEARQHILGHAPAKPTEYACTACGKTFGLRASMLHHVTRVHAALWHKCVGCKRQYRTQQALQRHMKTCVNLFPPEEKFACKDCGATFATALAMKRHRSEHSAESVRCKDCGLLVPMLDYAKHSATHAALGCRCAACGFKAKNSSDLARHIGSKHTKKKEGGLSCSQCKRWAAHCASRARA